MQERVGALMITLRRGLRSIRCNRSMRSINLLQAAILSEETSLAELKTAVGVIGSAFKSCQGAAYKE